MGFNMRQGGGILGERICGTSLTSLPAAAGALADPVQGERDPAPTGLPSGQILEGHAHYVIERFEVPGIMVGRPVVA